MILCPLQNSPEKPVITQNFGDRPEYYAKYKMKGHNGTDFRARTALPVFAPFSGEIIVENSANAGYGLHVRIRSRERGLEITLAHFSEAAPVPQSGIVNMGDRIGMTGNSGDSSAPHLHCTLRRIENHPDLKTFNLPVKDYDNGFLGAINPAPYFITWMGSLLKGTL